MKKSLKALFEEEHITHAALLPFSLCRVTHARLYERASLVAQSVIVFLIPYFVDTPDNFSAYAASEDYHLYVKELSARLLPRMEELFPGHRFLCYADHSPIDERHAAVIGGLGVYGRNGLLLSEEYGTYQFIGEILTDAPCEALGKESVFPVRGCEDCGACLRACPTGILRGKGEECLSAITQKKGKLTDEEQMLMRTENTAWGCDACQRVCPYTRRAEACGTIITPIPFFHRARITHFSAEILASLDDEAFARRAFSWRGRAVAERNARVLEK